LLDLTSDCSLSQNWERVRVQKSTAVLFTSHLGFQYKTTIKEDLADDTDGSDIFKQAESRPKKIGN